MSRKSRTVIGILAATIVTGAGAATMANAVATEQPAAVSVETPTPTVNSTGLPDDQQRTEELSRSVDDLAAQIGVPEQEVAAGAGTPTSGPTPTSARGGGADDQAAELKLEAEHLTVPPQVGAAPTAESSGSHESESHESGEPSDD